MQQESRAEADNREEEKRIQIQRQQQIKKRRQQQFRKQQKVRLLVLLLFLCLCGCVLICLGRELAKELHNLNSGNRNTQVSGVTIGTQKLDSEADARLQSLAQENPDIAEIYQDKLSYPAELLKALSLNQELLPFAKGWPDSDGSVTGGFTSEEIAQQHPLFLQWDSRWGYYPYGESCLGIAGCGPTCLSMVIFSLTGNEDATPDKLADYSMKNGHYVSGSGTAWTFMTDAPADYGITVKTLGLDEVVMRQFLDQGGMLICAMRPGDFTTAGHFIVIYGYDQDGFQVNDPNSRERSEKVWPFSAIKKQIKNMWGFHI